MRYLNPKGRWPSGNVRYYFRRGGRQIPMPDFPSDHLAFYEAYLDCMRQFDDGRPMRIEHRTGSIGAGIRAWLQSDDFMRRAPSTRTVWRRMLEAMEEQYGTASMVDLRARHIRTDLGQLDPHPANNRRKVWRALCRWWVDSGLIEINPATEVNPRHTPATRGHTPWTRDDVKAFRERWPYQTPQRLAFELLYWTGARRSDVVKLGPGMVDSAGWLVYTQQKTHGRVEVPWTAPAPTWAEPDSHLARAIEAQPKRHMTWLVTHGGQPRSVKAFGNWFGSAARTAGIKGKTAHGVRKLRGAIMRENGASLDQRKAWLGHDSDAEAEAYARSAELRRIISGTETAHSGETTAHFASKRKQKQ